MPAWTTLLGLSVFVLVLFFMHRLLGEYHWHDILASIRGISREALWRAVALAIAGYGCLSLYEMLAVNFAGARLPIRRTLAISLMAYGIGHTFGTSTLSGGAIRYRAYTLLGLGPKQIATIIAFGTLTFALGAAVLLGASLLAESELSAQILHLPVLLVRVAGIALIGAAFSYVLVIMGRSEPVCIRGVALKLPRTRVAVAQVLVACGDLLCAAGVLYVLLPAQAQIGFLSFAGIYLLGIAAGIVSTVPGGVGVFEGVLLLLLSAAPRDRLLGALLAYRAIYYLVPFAVALTLLAWHEVKARRGPVVRVLQLARTWLIAVAPQAIALAVFAAGAVLLFSGATPAQTHRVALLRDLVPLPVLELSHLLGSAVGVGLLILANGLYRRLDAAWWLTLWLLCAGALLSLLKGFDYEEALVLSAVAGLLVASRERFARRASLIEQRFSTPWLVALALVLGAATLLVGFAYRHVPYANDLWWQFAFEAPAPRSLRALLLALVVTAAYGLWRLLRPAPPALVRPSDADLASAAALIRANDDTTANLALLGDKNLFFNAGRSAFIMYQVSGRSWVAMGDPVGPWPEREALAWSFLERCDMMAASPVFYQVTPANLPLYVDLGLNLTKLGEEARVALPTFSLEGGARADLRQTHRRAVRDGATFEVVPRAEVGALIAQLKDVSDAWLADKPGGEKGFSLGYFDERYLANFDCALVRSGGRIVAFANLWTAGSAELSVDLMRFGDAAPKCVIDFLLIECMLWGRAQGFEWFNLGMAPLSGLEDHPLAPAWHKLGRLVQRYGENFYHFEGLRKFKEKFSPVWRPRYLAAPGGLSLAGALVDVTTLISGGVAGAFSK
ncbi:MAG: bifunctional lysylphosphatidylglycerol flippase/synthetase MprF [Steroidobacterales bacterium]